MAIVRIQCTGRNKILTKGFTDTGVMLYVALYLWGITPWGWG